MNARQSCVKFLGLAALMWGASGACAQWTTQASLPKPNGYKTNKPNWDGSLMTPGTSGAKNTEKWHISQWGTPDPLPAFNGKTDIASATASVSYRVSSTVLGLTGERADCNAEVNLFAEPTFEDTYSTGPFVGYQSLPLVAGTDSQLWHQLRIKVNQMQQVPYSTGCVSQGLFNSSLVLKNLDDPSLTLFYQITLAYVPVSPVRQPILNWWANGVCPGNPLVPNCWGFDDLITSYGYKRWPAVGSTFTFNRDIKGRLRAVIQDPANTIPASRKDPARWVVRSAYHGPHAWGGVRMNFEVDQFNLSDRTLTP